MKTHIPVLALLTLAMAPAALWAASPESEEYRWESPFPEAPALDSAILAGDSAGGPGGRATMDAMDSDSAQAATDADSAAVEGAPDLPHPSLAAPFRAGAAAAVAAASSQASLAILPTAPGREGRPVGTEREAVYEALRLAAEQAGSHRVLTVEETARAFGRIASLPADCFSGPCVAHAAHATRVVGADFLLVSELDRYRPKGASALRPKGANARRAPDAVLTLALVDSRTGMVRRAIRARACPGMSSPISFAQQAVWHLLLDLDREAPQSEASGGAPAAAPHAEASTGGETPGADPGPSKDAPPSSRGCSLVAELTADSGAWKDIAWLNPPAAPDGRFRFAAAGSGILAAGLGLAWAQGQLLQEDDNGASPSRALRGGGGADSWMRGFFAAPGLGARYAAMGGAGIARVDDAAAVILNPAGIADAKREDLMAAKRSLADGAPSFHLSYAGPFLGALRQGLAVQHEGDDLSNETVLQAVLAGDWGVLSPSLAGLRTGAGLKIYLARVGEEGTGFERSTGHSVGLGLDLGLKLKLSERITGALAVRDALGFLRHSNTFTDQTHWELLPPEYRVGAAYRVDSTTLLVLDGQKGMVADQVDHIRLGAEQTLFRFLSLRAGLHQAFGREAVRKFAVGFGLDSDGLSDRPRRARISVDYAFDFGLGADAPLGAGQQFSMSLSW